MNHKAENSKFSSETPQVSTSLAHGKTACSLVSDNMDSVLPALCSLPSLQGLCGVLFANQPTYTEGLVHANHQGADQELPDLMSVSPTGLQGTRQESLLFFLLTTALFNLAECLARGRDLNRNGMNERARETEREEATL